MKLWIDDVRAAPAGWTHVKTSREALAMLDLGALDLCQITEISFDHDLGAGGDSLDDTTMPVAKLLEERAYQRIGQPIMWHIHSANPVGRRNLFAALSRADEYWGVKRMYR